MKKINRFLSLAMVLLLLSTLVLPALAAEYDLNEGSVTINATANADGSTTQTVTHGTNAAVEDNAPVIINTAPDTTSPLTINAEAGASANVTLNSVNIDTNGTGATPVIVTTGENASVTIELEGESTIQGDRPESGSGTAGIQSTGDGTLVIQDADGDGKLSVTGGRDAAGIGGGDDQSSSNILITGGTIEATGGPDGAAIGGGEYGSGNVTITGGTVTANGGGYAAGIGGGYYGGGTVTITGGTVTATGDGDGAGIGGGYDGDGTVTITGGTVTANGSDYAAGIGGGDKGSGNVTITGGTIEATSGYMGAGIGGGAEGSSYVTINGGTVIATGGDGAAGIGGSHKGSGGNVTISGSPTVTAKGGDNGEDIGNGQLGSGITVDTSGLHTSGKINGTAGTVSHTYTAEATSPTCTTRGYTTYTCDCGHSYIGDYTDPTDHTWDDGIMTTAPTDTTDGLLTYTCFCGETYTEIIPAQAPSGDIDSGTASGDPTPVSPAPQSPAYDEVFWRNVEKQILAAKKGETITIDAGKRTTMPAFIMDAIEEAGIILVIQWNGGEDITIDKPYDGKKKYAIFNLKDLNDLLND